MSQDQISSRRFSFSLLSLLLWTLVLSVAIGANFVVLIYGHDSGDTYKTGFPFPWQMIVRTPWGEEILVYRDFSSIAINMGIAVAACITIEFLVRKMQRNWSDKHVSK